MKQRRHLALATLSLLAALGCSTAREAPPAADDPTALDPRADAEFERGVDLLQASDYQGALEAFDESLRLRPDFAKAYNGRGFARYGLGDFDGEVEDYSEAIRLDPEYAEASYNRGLVRASRLEDYEGAVADFEQALECDPDQGLHALVSRELAIATDRLAAEAESE